jgi:hypothetical protein
MFYFSDVIPEKPPKKSPSQMAKEADAGACDFNVQDDDDDIVVQSSQLGQPGTSSNRRYNTTGVREHLLLMAQEARREKR